MARRARKRRITRPPQLSLRVLPATTNSSTLRSRRRRAKMTANERTQEQSHYASKRRVDLIKLLSPDERCQCCGRGMEDASELTIHHVHGRTWRIQDLSPSQRVARYWREYERGVKLEAWCGPCNSVEGGGRRYSTSRDDPSEVPF